MDEKTRIKLILIDNKIRTLQAKRENILKSTELTNKESYYYYHE